MRTEHVCKNKKHKVYTVQVERYRGAVQLLRTRGKRKTSERRSITLCASDREDALWKLGHCPELVGWIAITNTLKEA